jgi:hypothetical protein
LIINTDRYQSFDRQGLSKQRLSIGINLFTMVLKITIFVIARNWERTQKGIKMNISTWPSNNPYFSNGIQVFIDENRHNFSIKQDHVIIDFRLALLKKIYKPNWMINFSEKKILIISDKYLHPLACYFFKTFDNIITVIEKKSATESLLNYFKYGKIDNVTGVSFSNREYASLVSFINAHSIKYQAKKLGINIKTAYAFRHSAAKKMSLKRLYDIYSTH